MKYEIESDVVEINIDGDFSDFDSIGVYKYVTATGSVYSISGPVAKVINEQYRKLLQAYEVIEFYAGEEPWKVNSDDFGNFAQTFLKTRA